MTAAVVVIVCAVALVLWQSSTGSTNDGASPVPVSSVGIAGSPSDRSSVAGSASAGDHSSAGPAAAGEPGPTPAVQPMALASGAFVDGEHATSGTASIVQFPDGSRYLRLQNFSTSTGPELRVWLTDKSAGGNDWGKYDDGTHLSLGDLKATKGNQDYPIPADANLSAFKSVVIWSDRTHVAFGTAPIGLGT